MRHRELRLGPRHERRTKRERLRRFFGHPLVAGSWIALSFWAAVILLSESAMVSYLHGWP